MDRRLQQIQWLASVAIALVLVVIFLGGWTRLNDAGLGCPDWPGCYGELILPESSQGLEQAQSRFPDAQLDPEKGWLEMVHRYAAGSLGVLILLLAVLSWRVRRLPGYPLKLAFGLLGLVTLQALFGMWTVTLKLLPQVVTLHLLGGLLTMTLLVRLASRLRQVRLQQEKPPASRAVRLAMVLLFIQLALGGWTSANYAGWACSDWLACNSDSNIELDFAAGFELTPHIGPDYEGGQRPVEARAAIQVGHRLMAVILVGYLFWLSWSHASGHQRRPAQWLCIAVMLQVGIGLANVIWALPLALATAHHAGAVVLLLSLLWLYEHSGYCPQEVHDERD